MLYSRAGLTLEQLEYRRTDEAQKDLETALCLFEESGDAYGRALVLSDLSAVDRLAGRSGLALEKLHSALPVLRSAGDWYAEAHAYNIMAKIALDRGRADDAERLLIKGTAICPQSASPRVAAQLAYWLGEVYRRRGELCRAEAEFRCVLQVTSERGDPVGKVHALLGVGSVRLATGDLSQAEVAFREALETSNLTADRLGRTLSHFGLTELALARGDLPQACTSLEAAEALLAGTGVARLQSDVLRLRERLGHLTLLASM